MNNQYKNPVAALTNRKTELLITDLPAVFGRNDNTVDVYFFHESISREHCVFEYINRGVTIKDLGSSAGTRINGVLIEPNVPYSIEDGAKVTLGKVKFVFHIDYEELANRDRMQARAHVEPAGLAANTDYMGDFRDNPYAGGASRQPAGRGGKVIHVDAKELNEYEYGEDEVVYIDCGFRAVVQPASYTQRELKKTDVENALEHFEQAAEKEKVQAVQPKAPEPVKPVQPEPVKPVQPEPAKAEPVKPSKPEPVMPEPTKPAEPVKPAPVKPVQPESVKAAPAPAVPEKAPQHTLMLSWNDDETGEVRKLRIDRFPFYIGRKSDENDYAIRRKGLSRKHMHFEEENGKMYLLDDNSTNGVKINGSKIKAGERTEIKSGDTIRVADINLSVSID